jgi:hypothetical protein
MLAKERFDCNFRYPRFHRFNEQKKQYWIYENVVKSTKLRINELVENKMLQCL